MDKKVVNKEKFGKRLTKLMEEKSETTYSMADRFSLSSPTISRYMTGQMAAKVTTIEMMAKYFDVNPVWLMGFDVSRDYPPSALTQPKESFPEIIFYYEQLNSLGKQTATEQVRLLTLDNKYTSTDIQPFPTTVQEPEPDYLKVNAAQTRTDQPVTQEDLDYDENLIQEYFRNKEKSDL